jgi:hypothetical protein
MAACAMSAPLSAKGARIALMTTIGVTTGRVRMIGNGAPSGWSAPAEISTRSSGRGGSTTMNRTCAVLFFFKGTGGNPGPRGTV